MNYKYYNAYMKIKLLQIRYQKNITLKQLSELSGISKSTISNIESEKVAVKIVQLEKIARALGCRISDLYDSPYK